jgi:hypothetical protein
MCFSFLKGSIFGQFFYDDLCFPEFNFLNPGKVNIIFKDRVLDTAIGNYRICRFLYCTACLGTYTKSGSDEKSAADNLIYFQR